MADDVQVTADFLAEYGKNRSSYVASADSLAGILKKLLESSNLFVHSVDARAKSLASVRQKQLKKRYVSPRNSMTDLIGLRVITYYSADVDAVADLIRANFTIHKGHSSDKRTALSLQEFGYRSYHLVAKLKPSQLVDSRFAFLKGLWFEIQVRSLLEHCWAAMEHEIVYKSGASFPNDCKRRFAAVAGALELLDREFTALRAEHSLLIDAMKSKIAAGEELSNELDTIRLLAGLELWRPDGLSFRGAEEIGKPFPPRIGTGLILALNYLEISTLNDLKKVFDSRSFAASVNGYATAEGVAPENVSHLAILSIVVGMLDWELLDVYFPELTDDRSLVLALQS